MHWGFIEPDINVRKVGQCLRSLGHRREYFPHTEGLLGNSNHVTAVLSMHSRPAYATTIGP